MLSYDPPPWSDLIDMANEAIAASESDVAMVTSDETDCLAVAFAATARCRRLMMGIVALVESDLDHVMGGLLRTLYETWLVGIYVLLGGDPALRHLIDKRDKEQKTFARLLGDPVDCLPDGKELRVLDLASAVTGLLEAESHEHAQFARRAYDSFYRIESYRSTHGGLGSVAGHIEEDGTSRRILARRPEYDDGMRHLFLMGVALLASSAQVPARRAGLPHGRLDKVGQAIIDLDPSGH